MSIYSVPNRGLKVSLSEYTPLKAFQAGGYFWDTQPQQIIRDALGDVLPAVQRKSDDGQSYALFSYFIGKEEILSRTKPIGRRKIPKKQLQRLEHLIQELQGKVSSEETQLTAKELIPKFRLPDPARDPELYRVSGFWWNRRLYVLWGCERHLDSSIEPLAAVAKIPQDDFHGAKQALAIFLLLAALILIPWLFGPPVKAYARQLMNKAPVAALNLDSSDQTNRTAIVSDAGSRDADGEIKKWNIDWGDGTKDLSIKAPLGIAKTYKDDGDYQISLTCTDNLGATSRPPATVNVKFNYDDVLSENARKAQRDAEASKQARLMADAEAKRQEENERKAQAEARSSEAARLEAEALAKSQKDNRLKAEADATAREEARRIAEAKAKDAEESRLQADAENRRIAEEKRTPNTGATSQTPQQSQTQSPRQPAISQIPEKQLQDDGPKLPTVQQDQPDKGGPKLNKGFPKRNSSPPDEPPIYSPDAEKAEIQIRGIGSGRLDREGKVEVTLAAIRAGNAKGYLQVEKWQIGDQTFSPKNPVFRTSLGKGDYMVKVFVRRQDGSLQEAAGVMKVNTSQTGEFSVEPTK